MSNPPVDIPDLIDAYLDGAESARLAIAGMGRDPLRDRPIANLPGRSGVLMGVVRAAGGRPSPSDSVRTGLPQWTP
jgi:hypothetical protein